MGTVRADNTYFATRYSHRQARPSRSGLLETNQTSSCRRRPHEANAGVFLLAHPTWQDDKVSVDGRIKSRSAFMSFLYAKYMDALGLHVALNGNKFFLGKAFDVP